MERLALILAQRLIGLDTALVPQILWDAAKLYRQSENPTDRQHLLAFQASVCAMTGRPAIAPEADAAAAASPDALRPVVRRAPG